MLVFVIWISYFLFSEGENFINIIRTAKLHMIFFVLVTHVIVVGVINPYLHSIAYKEIGSTVSFWQAFRIFHLSRIGNYLPGRVWFATNYYLFSKKMDIDSDKIAKNFIILNVLLFLVGGLCSLPIINLFSPQMQNLLMIFPFMMMILIHPKIFKILIRPVIGKKNGKDYRYAFLFKISMLYFIAYAVLGFGLYFGTLSFTSVDLTALPIMVGAASSSLIVGMLAIFAPAGIGVSEGISAAILSQVISLEIAIMVVVTLRMVMVLVDFSCALISAVSIAREEKLVKQALA